MARLSVRHIESVAIDRPDSRVERLHIEDPKLSFESDCFALRIRGFLILKDKSPSGQSGEISAPKFEVYRDGWELLDQAQGGPRADVEAVYGKPGVFGFETLVTLVDCRGEIELQLRIDFGNGDSQALANLRVWAAPLQLEYQPRYQPVLLTTLGRTGSSVVMKALAVHPELICQGRFPYENKSALFWTRAASLLGSPANLTRSTRGHAFEFDRFKLGIYPFSTDLHLRETDEKTSSAYFREMPRMHYEHFLRVADVFYGAVALDQGKPDAASFVEKSFTTSLAAVARELYPRSKEVLLVRDPRDVLLSALAFDRKNGLRCTDGMAAVDDPEVRRIWTKRIAQFARASARRFSRPHVLRYEDLMADRVSSLRRLFEYLEVDSRESTVAGICERLDNDAGEAGRHRTSKSVPDTIQRWKRELTGDLAEFYTNAFSPYLQQFGY